MRKRKISASAHRPHFTMLLCLLLLVSVAGAAQAWGLARSKSIIVNGEKREYLLHLPKGINGSQRLPLLLVFHGGTRNARKVRRTTGFDALADRYGFIVAYPNSIDGHWNDGRVSPAGRPDDVRFTITLIDELVRRYPIDTSRIYATGPSNGGFMVQQLACLHADRFAAVASVIATMPEHLSKQCNLSAPLSMMLILGTDDPFVPWKGGVVKSKVGGCVFSGPATLDFWVKRLGCAKETSRWLPDTSLRDKTRVRETRFHCRAHTELVFTVVEGGGHTWPGYRIGPLIERVVGRETHDIDGAEYVWNFLSGKRRATTKP